MPILEEASALMAQKKETEAKQQLLNAFTKHFIISEEDLLLLTSAEEPINDHFFDILAKVKQVHRDCEVLLGGENQRLGLEIMEQSSRNLSSAYHKLYRWIQKEFKSLNLEDPRISSSIRRALRVLAERPSLFHSCLDFFAEARDYILSDAFHYALTDSAANTTGRRTVKPIEFSAHDPLRYIGDMLAWVHSTTVSEREALEALFIADGDELASGIQAGLSSEPWSRIDGEEVAFDGQKALSDLVSRDLAGVSRALRQRVELVIQGHEDPVTCFKVVNLLAFYRTTYSKLVGPQSTLSELTQTLEDFTFGHFEVLIRDQISALSTDHSALTPSKDLSAPQFLLDASEVLTSLMKTHEASLLAGDLEASSKAENSFTPVLLAAFDPFLNLAKSSADELQDHTARTIYLTNIHLSARSTISEYTLASATHLEPLSAALSDLRIALLEIQQRYLLQASGLQELLTALEPFSSSKPIFAENGEQRTQAPQQRNIAEIANLPAFQPEALASVGQQLDDFLASALMDATENLKRVQSAAFIKSITEEAVEAFCRDFEFVEGMIIGADEARGKIDVVERESEAGAGSETGTEDTEFDWSLRALFPRTTGEIRVLLS